MAPITSSVVPLLAVLLFSSSCSAGWALQDTYDASNFFSEFDFFTGADPTNGLVAYQAQSAAQQQGLINTNNGKVYMGVDHTNVSPNGRASVRVTSQKTYNAGSLMILDLAHMPEGLGTWPAFWTVGSNWPANGEIDIIEGVNAQTTNAMTLHTASGCSISGGTFSGKINTNNCFVQASGQPNNAGCSIGTTNTQTYGAGLNAIGGGVYAMEWTTSAISVYFFPRSAIPSDITSGNPNPAGWGTPLSQFTGGCNIPQFFNNHQIVFDTTFCGDWAGNVWTSTGGSSSTTCNAYVANTPSAFTNAYWSVNSLKVYTVSSNTTPDAAASSPDVPATTAEESSSVPQATGQAPSQSSDQGAGQTANNNPPASSVNPATSATQAAGDNNPTQVASSGTANQNGGANTAPHSHHHHPRPTAVPSAAQAGTPQTSAQASAGSSDSVNKQGTSSPAATAEEPQAVQVGEGGVIFEGPERKFKSRRAATPHEMKHAHLHKQKRHSRIHGRRSVQPVGPPGGVWRE